LFILRATSTQTRLRRLLYLLTVGRYGGSPQDGGVKDPLGKQWPSSLPLLLGLWLENDGVYGLPGVLNF
jgi:hypothetical protein